MLIFLILLISAILRFWDLAGMPPHLRNDEAALGYNAYTILNSARDEHGQFLPLIFQSFGDWKMGLYIYLTVPFVAVGGLNELAVRLPSAISGIIAVLLIYKIVGLLFNQRLALISSLVFAISPLLIVFSRGAWEVNLSLTLTIAAILFFLKSFTQEKFFLLSGLFFGLTLLASHTAKLSTPLLIAILLIAFYKRFKKISTKIVLFSILIFLTFTIPVSLSFLEGKVARITALSIFSYNLSPQDIWQSVATRWFNLYSASTLFLKGDSSPQHTAPSTGPLLLVDGILLILGAIKLIRTGTREQNLFLWLSFALLSLPSVLTIEKINLERVLPMFIPILILVSIGINSLFSFKKFIIAFCIIYALNYFYFLDQYFVHGQKKNDAWQYGYKQVIEKLKPIKQNYQKIIVQQTLEYPYIFFLFFDLKDEKIEFSDIDWSAQKPQQNYLYVMPQYKLDQQSSFYQVIDEVRDLNGFVRFVMVKI